MKIIEISGVPGSGKTTMLDSIRTSLPKNWDIFPNDSSSNYTINILKNKINSFFYLFIFMLFKPFYTFKLIKYLSIYFLKSKESIYSSLYLLLNILFKISYVFFKIKFKPKNNVIIDEGISHIPFNMISYKSNQINIDAVKIWSFLKDLTKNIDVLILDISKKEAHNRIFARGHKRLKNKEDINNFLNLNNETINLIKSESQNLFKSSEVINVEQTNYRRYFFEFFEK